MRELLETVCPGKHIHTPTWQDLKHASPQSERFRKAQRQAAFPFMATLEVIWALRTFKCSTQTLTYRIRPICYFYYLFSLSMMFFFHEICILLI